jgi:hypothetical protein
VELLDVTGRRLVAEAAGDLWSKSADGAAMAGRLLVEVGRRRYCLETVGSVLALHLLSPFQFIIHQSCYHAKLN